MSLRTVAVVTDMRCVNENSGGDNGHEMPYLEQ